MLLHAPGRRARRTGSQIRLRRLWSHTGGEPGACSYHGGEASGSSAGGSSSGGDYSLQTVTDDGAVVVLDDGSIWCVDAGDQGTTSSWSDGDSITVAAGGVRWSIQVVATSSAPPRWAPTQTAASTPTPATTRPARR